MKWLELSVDSPAEFVEPLTRIFRRYGQGGVVTEFSAAFSPDEGEVPPLPNVVTVKTYLPVDDSTQTRRGHIDVGIRLVAHVGSISQLREKEIGEEDWANSWKEHFHVLRVGRHLVVCPTWRPYNPTDGDVVIRLDPGMAFGTGHHPTTRMCMELLEGLVPSGGRVLDVGTGSGILSISAVKLGAQSAIGLEIETSSVSAAIENVKLNDLQGTVTVLEGTLPHPAVAFGGYDVVIANISGKVLIDICPHLVAATKPNGRILLSGILRNGIGVVVKALELEGACVAETVNQEDWVAMVVRPGNRIKIDGADRHY